MSFGGPESIVASGSQVRNPFVFKFSAQLEEQQAGGPSLSGSESRPGTSDVQVGIHQ